MALVFRIRIQQGPWTRMRIQDGTKWHPKQGKDNNFHVEELDVLLSQMIFDKTNKNFFKLNFFFSHDL
jgi:hypothetical protein